MSTLRPNAFSSFCTETYRVAADIPDLSKYFGKDSTPGGIQFQFRTLKDFAKRQKACADAGGDPQMLGIGRGGSQVSSTYLSFLLSLPLRKSANLHVRLPCER
jgi:hypothetical protein